MNWIRRFFYGRNGPDQLGLATMILGLLLLIISGFVPLMAVRALIQLLYYACVFLFFYRMVSRNLYPRQAENRRYLAVVGRVKSWLRLRGKMLREWKSYRYLHCPSCRQWLRAPRGKGKIRVRCQKCGEQFERKV